MIDNKAMQDSGVEWIGAIPQSWKMCLLKRTTYIKGRIGWQGLTSSEYLDEGCYLLVTGTDFKAKYISWNACHYVEEARYLEDGNIQLQEEDVLVTKDGTIGKIAMVKNMPYPATLNSGVFVTRPYKNEYLQHYMYWVLSSDIFPEFIHYSKVGTTIVHLYQKVFERFKYPLPPLSEQRYIVGYLNQHCDRLDAIIAIKQQQIKSLDALRQSIIYQAVTQGLDDSVPLVDSGVEWLGKIPQGWRVSKLKYITSQIVDGTHFTPNYVENGVPFLRVTDIQTQSINFEKIKFITEEEHAELIKRAKPQKGDVLLSKNGTIGITKVVDWEWEFSIFVSLCLIKFLPNINPYYFSYFFESDVANQQLFESSKKTSVTNLHLVKIRELLLCIPPFFEQQRIIDYLDQETQRLNDLKANLNQQVSTLEAYKRALIYECVTGKKRIKAGDLKTG